MARSAFGRAFTSTRSFIEVAYLGAALALAQGLELVGDAFQWSDLVSRVVMIALIAGFPLAITSRGTTDTEGCGA